MQIVTRIQAMALMISLLGCSLMAVGGEGEVKNEALRNSFASAQTEHEKLDLAIKIIESNNLRTFSTLSDFDNAFGTNLDVKRERPIGGGLATSTIFFREQVASRRDEYAASYAGWYLVIKYDAGGVVHHYYISNAHK